MLPAHGDIRDASWVDLTQIEDPAKVVSKDGSGTASNGVSGYRGRGAETNNPGFPPSQE